MSHKYFFNTLLSVSLILITLVHVHTASAQLLKGSIGIHDPSTIVKSGSTYWIFMTGSKIPSRYSTDLITWTDASVAMPTRPSWIDTTVPNFKNNNDTYWAPDIAYFGGKYYLYYSCSTFGSPVSAIGVATAATPTGPWTDQGMVVQSQTTSNFNAIDPSILVDGSNVYMAYGSWSAGIAVVQLDPSTGKVKSGSTPVRVAGGSGADWEGACLIKEGSYYYLFVNRGSCCNGTSSTYYIIVGRSTSPTGPFVDKNGTDLKSGGGSTLLGSSGRFIGPGHVGLLRQAGSNFVSIHFYDGNDNGAPKLDIINMGFSSNWPFLTRDWIAAGTYTIKNVNSGMNWDAWGCTGVTGQAVAQGTASSLTCQKWIFTTTGNGSYQIRTAMSTGNVVDIINCGSANGTKLQLYSALNNDCQKFRVFRTADGSHIFNPVNSEKVVEVPGASTIAGTQLGLWDYNGCTCQKWTITTASNSRLAFEEVNSDDDISVYPNPTARNKGFSVVLGEKEVGMYARLNLIDSKGSIAKSKKIEGGVITFSELNLASGLYIIQLVSENKVVTRKVILE
ncbi:family 43 glycosylhydrolase [Cytophagaceae bacterium YF14B1]|uniref:Family 43 glycosylhydrolase n=1 Tax=Xanthocytophaga flava TaxID=3048013 RepID=A0AAE3QV01_9BACT|nr:family 43 glycosylhydrolase [Xanthocytophaga flavus]MDJ1483791.1 family 43 glycosylhydrolase [Xanthocytophaga flavus]